MVPSNENRRQSTSTIDDGDEELDAISDVDEYIGSSRFLGKVGEMQKPRQDLTQTPKKPKTVKGIPSLFTPKPELKMKQLEGDCRVVFLLNLNLDKPRQLIMDVWGPDIRTGDWEWKESENRIQWNASNWKRSTLARMDVKVREYLE
ncbi:MAG: hypothetical protein Q9180_009095 [Flavoplaca navasiana]